MDRIIEGKVVLLGEDVNTDDIIPARCLTTADPEELKDHLFECHPAGEKIKPGDIIAAGRNFGSGSSREHAPLAILGAGVKVVLAESFARIFLRNSINIGLLVLEVPGAGSLKDGEEITINLDKGEVSAPGGVTLKTNPVPEFISQIVEAGGLIPWIRAGGLS